MTVIAIENNTHYNITPVWYPFK